MVKNHLSYFRVDNFKKFSSLELADIGQFNLIVGDNNVGKTSLLEAISVFSRYDNEEVNSNFTFFPSNIATIMKDRGFLNDVNSEVLYKYISQESKLNVGFFAKGSGYNLKFTIKKRQWDVVYSVNGTDFLRQPEVDIRDQLINSFGIKDTPLVRPLLIQNAEIVQLYQNVINYSRSNKTLIIKSIQTIDHRIVDIEVLPIVQQQYVMMGFDDSDKFLPISSLGDSVIRVFFYLLKIVKNKGGFLLIDEIESGIHYSRLIPFLKNIMQLAIQNDVQLFMTTHSLECQQAFVEVFKEKEMEQYQSKARQFSLLENTDGKISASVRNFEQLEHALDSGFDTRGGNKVW